ncbi:membrane dipeptidase [Streptomyces sp. NPDC048254]|uniref:membrane dipeptidase n=1 Tax=Streptomyces sp. NPDC048254 TaxID=3365525 RepID=UPI003712C68B
MTWNRPRAPRPGGDPVEVAEEHAEAFGAALEDRLKSWLGHIGLGGDYDGVDHQLTGLADVSGHPVLLRELTDRGWSSRPELEALTGRNVLRILRAAEERATGPHWPTVPLR